MLIQNFEESVAKKADEMQHLVVIKLLDKLKNLLENPEKWEISERYLLIIKEYVALKLKLRKLQRRLDYDFHEEKINKLKLALELALENVCIQKNRLRTDLAICGIDYKYLQKHPQNFIR